MNRTYLLQLADSQRSHLLPDLGIHAAAAGYERRQDGGNAAPPKRTSATNL